MKTLIYQFWKGSVPAYARLSARLFADYAKRHGADYRFDENPDFFKGKYSEYYHALRPIYDDSFLAYDRVIFVDCDVYPKAAASADLLTCDVGHIGMVEEVAPEIREDRPRWLNDRNDRRWAIVCAGIFRATLPRSSAGTARIFNSGVIVYTREGLQAARRHFPSLNVYSAVMRLVFLPRFYRLDQNYLGMACFRKGMEFTVLDHRWNRIVKARSLDENRLLNEPWGDTEFVHWQVRDRRDYTESQIIAMVESA